jgi:hypothetical protein
VVHVLGVEDGGTGTEGGFYDKGVPVADAALLNAGEGELDERCVDGDDCMLSKPSNHRSCLGRGEWRISFPHRVRGELAEHLCTEDQRTLINQLRDQSVRNGHLVRGHRIALYKSVDEDIRVYERGHMRSA